MKLPEDRFWMKVKKREGTCWTWTAATDKDGYGVFWYNNKAQYAHRVSWQLTNGLITSDQVVCHRCDNPLCVRPDHLFLGSYYDNILDKVKKQRSSLNEQNPNSKLTKSQVRDIKKRASKETQTALAKEFGVSRKTIYLIINGQMWANVEEHAPVS